MTPSHPPAVIRRNNQARAVCHSRVTVAREIDNTAADLLLRHPAEVPQLHDLGLGARRSA